MSEEVKQTVATSEENENSQQEVITPEDSEKKTQEVTHPEEKVEEKTALPPVRKKTAADRIKEITAEKWAERLAKEEAKKRVSELEAEVTKLKAKIGTASTEPKIDMFETNEEYIKALTKYEFDRRESEKAAEILKRKEETEKLLAEKRQATFLERVELAKEHIPDLEKALSSVIASPAMIEILQESEVGPEIAHYLHHHEDVAKKIAGLSSNLAIAKEMGKLEIQIMADKTRKTVSNASEPINPVETGGSGEIDESKLSDDAWYKRRQAQRLQKLREQFK